MPEQAAAVGSAAATGEFPKVYRTTRLAAGQLIFPQQLIFDAHHVLTRKRKFPLWWIVHEESIPYAKIGSVSLKRGLMYSTVEIENTGGVDPIVFKGIGNQQALEVRDLIERMTRGPE
ncbi:MAG TPA: hypothetical protein VEI97_12860 [bacterium]|nr:hypothetical protein [bacterium]